MVNKAKELKSSDVKVDFKDKKEVDFKELKEKVNKDK